MEKLNSVGLVDRREQTSCYCSAAVLQRLNLSSFGIYGFGIEPYRDVRRRTSKRDCSPFRLDLLRMVSLRAFAGMVAWHRLKTWNLGFTPESLSLCPKHRANGTHCKQLD